MMEMLRFGHREMQMEFGGLPVCDRLCPASFFQTWASSASRSSGSGLLSDHKASVLLLWWIPEKQHKGKNNMLGTTLDLSNSKILIKNVWFGGQRPLWHKSNAHENDYRTLVNYETISQKCNYFIVKNINSHHDYSIIIVTVQHCDSFSQCCCHRSFTWIFLMSPGVLTLWNEEDLTRRGLTHWGWLVLGSSAYISCRISHVKSYTAWEKSTGKNMKYCMKFT